MSTQPTVEDLALDPAALLATCEDRIRHGWHDLPIFASAPLTIAALCRRLLAAEAELLDQRAERENIVCLIGSSKFRSAFVREGRRLETTGHLVLCMSFFQHSDGIPVTDEERRVLEKVDRRRIDMAGKVVVVNVAGYIGASTRKEIAYAESLDRRIRYLEPT